MSDTIKRALKAAGITSAQSFVALFTVTVLGVLGEVVEWASSSGAEPLPGLSVLGYGFVAALGSAAIGFVTFIHRLVKDPAGTYAPKE